MTIIVDFATAVGAAVARDFLPPEKSVTKSVLRIVGHRWQDKKALDVLRNPPAKPKPAGPITMFDAVTVENIPAGAAAVAGYVNGLYVTVGELEKRFPHAHLLTIAVTVDADADCLDVENGDATPEQAPAWVKRQIARGLRRPCVYANRSTMPAVWAALKAADIERNDVRLLVADWTNEPHIPAGYDACQWRGGLTVPYDESLCSASFFA